MNKEQFKNKFKESIGKSVIVDFDNLVEDFISKLDLPNEILIDSVEMYDWDKSALYFDVYVNAPKSNYCMYYTYHIKN